MRCTIDITSVLVLPKRIMPASRSSTDCSCRMPIRAHVDDGAHTHTHARAAHRYSDKCAGPADVGLVSFEEQCRLFQKQQEEHANSEFAANGGHPPPITAGAAVGGRLQQAQRDGGRGGHLAVALGLRALLTQPFVSLSSGEHRRLPKHTPHNNARTAARVARVRVHTHTRARARTHTYTQSCSLSRTKVTDWRSTVCGAKGARARRAVRWVSGS